MRNKLILLLAVAFALFAALGTYQYLSGLKEAYRQEGNIAKVATAKQRIPAKTVITEQMLNFIEMPARYIIPGSVVTPGDAVGKLARRDILPGEQVLTGMLIGKNDPAGGLGARVVAGKRAITIPANNVNALHGLLAPGDLVDVIVTFNTPSGQEKQVVTSTVIQSVPVLAVNRITEAAADSKEKIETATLMVDPAQAQQVALAVQQGNIHLVLRTPEDKATETLRTTNLNHLLR